MQVQNMSLLDVLGDLLLIHTDIKNDHYKLNPLILLELARVLATT